MKVLFVYSVQSIQSGTTPLWKWTHVQFGISYISSMLKENGHETSLSVLGSENNKSISILKKCIDKFNPDIVCYTAISSQYPFIERMANFVKKIYPNKFYLIGGVHASLYPEGVINGPFDALCIGEGEYPTLELCNQLKGGHKPHNIKNLWIKLKDGQIEKNETRDFIQKLDKLPFPDREMWKPWIKERGYGEVSILAGRGCPFNCTYCSNHVLRKLSHGAYTRTRSVENILNEIDFLFNRFPKKNIFFEAETLAAKKEWLFDLLNEISKKNNNSTAYACNFRISKQSVDEQLFRAFKSANFKRLNIGLESGSERVRREILKRNYSNEEFLDTVYIAQRHGIHVHVFNMIGLPGETLQDHMETVELNRKCQPGSHGTGIFFPYYGTELYYTCVKNGYINENTSNSMERKVSVLDLPNFSRRQIKMSYILFNYRVYRGYRPLWLLLLELTRTWAMSYRNLDVLYNKIAQMPVFRMIEEKLHPMNRKSKDKESRCAS